MSSRFHAVLLVLQLVLALAGIAMLLLLCVVLWQSMQAQHAAAVRQQVDCGQTAPLRR